MLGKQPKEREAAFSENSLCLTDGGTSYWGYLALIIQVTETLSSVLATWFLENQVIKALAFVLLPGVRG